MRRRTTAKGLLAALPVALVAAALSWKLTAPTETARPAGSPSPREAARPVAAAPRDAGRVSENPLDKSGARAVALSPNEKTERHKPRSRQSRQRSWVASPAAEAAVAPPVAIHATEPAPAVLLPSTQGPDVDPDQFEELAVALQVPPGKRPADPETVYAREPEILPAAHTIDGAPDLSTSDRRSTRIGELNDLLPEFDQREVPSQSQPWWRSKIADPLRDASQTRAVNLESLILGALRHSPKVRAISKTPLIRETAVAESAAQFDWRAFMETRFTDTSDPVGSTLTTGGPSRLLDQNWRYSGGLRRKTQTGGKFELSQRIGLEDSNSQFFRPTDQANSKLALSFTQPLLNGAGRTYNTSLIVLAQIDAASGQDEFAKQLQDHLLEVTRAYWNLHLHRAVLLQKRKLHREAGKILDELESRREIDALQSQIVRARAAVAAREAEIIRTELAIRNTESKLRVLVNDPELLPNQQTELVPTEAPSGELIEVSLSDSLATALQHRPEIEQAANNVRGASVRLGISKQELLPVLDLVAETYASGLTGDFTLGHAYGDQFSEGRPSYSVGLTFEIPLCNREAKARHQRRQLELEQLQHELQNTIETLKAEVEVAVRQVETSFREMQSKSRAMTATAEEVRYLTERWRLLPGEDQAASFLLDDLLTAQERLAAEEFDYVSAQVAYTVSLSELKRANGTLLQAEHLEMKRTEVDSLPGRTVDKQRAEE